MCRAVAVTSLNSPKIQSQAELEELVEIERRKIDPQNKSHINARLLSEDEGASNKPGNGEYEIKIGGYLANTQTLRLNCIIYLMVIVMS